MVDRGLVVSMIVPPIEDACGHAEDINAGDEECSIPYAVHHQHGEHYQFTDLSMAPRRRSVLRMDVRIALVSRLRLGRYL
jgi:hypothetical protein